MLVKGAAGSSSIATTIMLTLLNFPWKHLTLFPWNFTWLTHWGRDRMITNFLTKFWNAFCWIYKFWLRFYWSLFPMVQSTVIQHWFRSEPMMASLLTHICVAQPQWVNMYVGKFFGCRVDNFGLKTRCHQGSKDFSLSVRWIENHSLNHYKICYIPPVMLLTWLGSLCFFWGIL